MNCETCDSQLLDLLYEELAPAQAEEMRAHLADCESCGAAFSKLSEGMDFAMRLPMLEPSPSVEAAIMDVARSRISGLPQAGMARPVVAEGDDEPSLLEKVVDWLRDFATGPQAAMATVMLLVIAIGVWYVPHGAPTTFEATGTTVMSPDPEGEAMPSALPAGEFEAQPVALAELEEAVDAPAEPNRQLRRSRPMARSTRSRSAGGRGGASAAMSAARNDDPLALADSFAAQEAPPRDGLGAVASAPSTASAPSRRSASSTSPAGGANDDALAGAPAAEARAQRAPASPAPSPTAGARAEQAERGYAAADEEESAEASDETVAVSMHRLAENLRRQDRCASAVSHYESLLSRFPDYERGPQAMVELADCYRRIGRLEQARRWVTRAQRNRSTSAVATRLLRQIEADATRSGGRAAPAAAAAAEVAH